MVDMLVILTRTSTTIRPLGRRNLLLVVAARAIGRTIVISLANSIRIGALMLKLVKLWTDRILASENVSLDEPRHDLAGLIGHMSSHRYREDIVQFFQTSLLGLWKPEEDHDEGNHIKRSI